MPCLMTIASSSGRAAVDPCLPLHPQPSESQHSRPDGPLPRPHPGRDRRRHAEPRSQLPRQPQDRDHSPMARLPAALGSSSPGNEGRWGTERAQPDPAGVQSPVPRDPARTRSRPHWCLFCSSFISGAPSASPYWCTHLPVPGAPAEPGQQHTAGLSSSTDPLELGRAAPRWRLSPQRAHHQERAEGGQGHVGPIRGPSRGDRSSDFLLPPSQASQVGRVLGTGTPRETLTLLSPV